MSIVIHWNEIWLLHWEKKNRFRLLPIQLLYSDLLNPFLSNKTQQNINIKLIYYLHLHCLSFFFSLLVSWMCQTPIRNCISQWPKATVAVQGATCWRDNLFIIPVKKGAYETRYIWDMVTAKGKTMQLGTQFCKSCIPVY